MAQNDFLPFAIAVGANVLDQTDYSTLPALSTGFQSGLASSQQINKAIRQATVMAAVLGQWIADTTGNDVLDNGDTSALVSYLGQAVGNISAAHIASASGSADAITATFSPAITLSNGMVVYVRAAYSNATTTPTFNPDDLGALPIVKGSNLPLAVGDIGGAGYWMILQYDQAFNKWVLQNPATGINIVIPSTMPVGAIYVQFAGQSDPTTLFGGTWDNISNTYAGLFFRAEGGDAATFGETQTGGAPNIAGSMSVENNNIPFLTNSASLNVSGCFASATMGNGATYTGVPTTRPIGVNFSAANANATYGAADEIRPANSTIRIWKRTA